MASKHPRTINTLTSVPSHSQLGEFRIVTCERHGADQGGIVVEGALDQVPWVKIMPCVNLEHSPAKEVVLETMADVGSSVISFAQGIPAEMSVLVGASASSAAELTSDALKDLPPHTKISSERLTPIAHAVAKMVGLLVSRAADSRRSREALGDDAQVLADLLLVVLAGDREQLQPLIDALDPPPEQDPGRVDLEEARARARLRMQAIYRLIQQESRTVAQLEEWGISRQRLHQHRAGRHLFAVDVPHVKGLSYPDWQFGPDRRPRQIMPELIGAAEQANLDAIGLHLLMTRQRADGSSGVQLLEGGRDDLVLSMIRGVDR